MQKMRNKSRESILIMNSFHIDFKSVSGEQNNMIDVSLLLEQWSMMALDKSTCSEFVLNMSSWYALVTLEDSEDWRITLVVWSDPSAKVFWTMIDIPPYFTPAFVAQDTK